MRLCSISSGSRGNAILAYSAKTKLLVDCGISGKTVCLGLETLGITPDSLQGILVTHEHIDHTKGIGILSRKFDLPIYATESTWKAMPASIGKIAPHNIQKIHADDAFFIDDIKIAAFPIPHDAANPIGYTLSANGEKVAVATDIGELQEGLFRALKGCQSVLLEANHDINMLEIGHYPFPLKRRIRGKLGHLSNDEAGKAAEFLFRMGVKKILLGHLSQENNYPMLALQTVKNILTEANILPGQNICLEVALQNQISAII